MASTEISAGNLEADLRTFVMVAQHPNPVASDILYLLPISPFAGDFTIQSVEVEANVGTVWCEIYRDSTALTPTAQDAGGSVQNTTEFRADNSGGIDGYDIASGTISTGEAVELQIASVSGSPTSLRVMVVCELDQ